MKTDHHSLVAPCARFLPSADAHVVRLRIERRELILNGRAFGAAGPYEKLVGKVDFGLDPSLPRNGEIVDLKLAPRNAKGEVEASADFYMLKPVDPRKGNGRLFYEVGNRGGKSMLATFQKAAGSPDPTTEAQFGDGALMRQGFTLLWMGWQWDVPERPGTMRMEMPIATENGKPITGIVRGNFILNERAATASVADRAHQAYPVLDRNSAENVMTVRDDPTAKGQVIPRTPLAVRGRRDRRARRRLRAGPHLRRRLSHGRSARARLWLSGARDLISFLKYDTLRGQSDARHSRRDRLGRVAERPLPAPLPLSGFQRRRAGTQGVRRRVRSGRRRRSRLVQPPLRPGLARCAAVLQHPVSRSICFRSPTVRQPIPRAARSTACSAAPSAPHTAPKVFHLLTNSEYFNRAGSLVHTDASGTKDAELPPNTRVYMIASAPHGPGPFPPVSNVGGGMTGRAALNPLNYSPAVRALFRALDRWIVEDVAPPPSAYPTFADGTLTSPAKAGWPAIPGYQLPQQPLRAFHLNFGADWAKGIVSVEPPEVGKPFTVSVPAVDADGNVRAGIRLPDIAVPLATQAGWNYRDASIGAPDRLAGEIGSYIPFARTKAERDRAGDPRLSIEERYRNRDEYVGKFAAAALDLVDRGYLLPDDVADLIKHAAEHYDWAIVGRK